MAAQFRGDLAENLRDASPISLRLGLTVVLTVSALITAVSGHAQNVEVRVPFVTKYMYVCDRAAKEKAIACISRWRDDEQLGYPSCNKACVDAHQQDKINLKTYFLCEAGCKDRSRLTYNICLSNFGCQKKFVK